MTFKKMKTEQLKIIYRNTNTTRFFWKSKIAIKRSKSLAWAGEYL